MRFKTYREAAAYAARHNMTGYRIRGLVFGEVVLTEV